MFMDSMATYPWNTHRLTHHVHILEMNGENFRLRESRKAQT